MFERRPKSLFPEERSEQAIGDFRRIADALGAGRLPEPGVWARLQANVEDMLRIKREYTNQKQMRRAQRSGTQRPPPIDRAMRQAATVLPDPTMRKREGERERYEERVFWRRATTDFGDFLTSLRIPKMNYDEMVWKRMERAIKVRILAIQYQRLHAMPDPL